MKKPITGTSQKIDVLKFAYFKLLIVVELIRIVEFISLEYQLPFLLLIESNRPIIVSNLGSSSSMLLTDKITKMIL